MKDDGEIPDLIPVDVDEALVEMLTRHPLPAGVLDADCNQEQIAMALGTTVNTVAKWIRQDGMPVAQHGGNGRAYILRLSHCWAWRAARDAEAARQDRHTKAQITAFQASFLGLDVSDPTAQLSAKERRELADADIAFSTAARLRRQLVPLTDVRDLIESIFKIVREGMENMPDRLERELGLKSDQLKSVSRIGRDVLTNIEAKIEEAELTDRDVPDVEVGERWVI